MTIARPRDRGERDAGRRGRGGPARRCSATDLILRPIGRVGESPDGPVIDIDPEFGDGLGGLTEGQRLWVFFWMDRLAVEARGTLRAHPMGDNTAPERGVFSLRSPARPNPLGLTLVELVRRDGRRLFVRGLDALPGSPVIDLKPWTEKDC